MLTAMLAPKSVGAVGENWTYESEVDMTNGGADDQTAITVASGLPSGILTIEIMYDLVSTNSANQALVIRLGDVSSFEDADYQCSTQSTSTQEHKTDGFYHGVNAQQDAADTASGVMELTRWDSSEHLWFMRAYSLKQAGSPRLAVGFKTLTGELTRLQATTTNGTAVFDGGDIRMRYIK